MTAQTQNQDMTSGSPFRHIVTFMIPLFLGSLLQQCYNMVDAAIVGRFVGPDALAALGVANPIFLVVLFLFIGLCMGIGVVLSQLFGAHDYAGLKRGVSTALLSGLGLTVVIVVLCLLLSRQFLLATHTPADILEDANTYLRIVFIGLFFSFLYNFYAFAMRSIGNAKAPLFFLLLSSLLNIVLDFCFVVGLQAGVAGAAIATVIAQGCSFLCCWLYIRRRLPLIHLTRQDFVFDSTLLKSIVQYSFAAACQQVYIYLGLLLVQGLVNGYGTRVIAAFNGAERLDTLLQTAGLDFANALTTFTAQNYGAGKIRRVKEGFKVGFVVMPIIVAVMMLLGILGGRWLMAFFVERGESDIIAQGAACIRVISYGYWLAETINLSQGLFRGVGMLKINFSSTLFSITTRVGLSYLLSQSWGMAGVWWAIPCSWIPCAIFCIYHVRRFFLRYPEPTVS